MGTRACGHEQRLLEFRENPTGDEDFKLRLQHELPDRAGGPGRLQRGLPDQAAGQSQSAEKEDMAQQAAQAWPAFMAATAQQPLDSSVDQPEMRGEKLAEGGDKHPL